MRVLPGFGNRRGCAGRRGVTAGAEAGSGRDVTGSFRDVPPLRPVRALSEFLADHIELAVPLGAAPPNQRRAILYFAAATFASKARPTSGRRDAGGSSRRWPRRAGRDLALVLNEASSVGVELFVGERPPQAGPPGVLAVGLLTVVTWQGARPPSRCWLGPARTASGWSGIRPSTPTGRLSSTRLA